jgi:hypothetical protein
VSGLPLGALAVIATSPNASAAAARAPWGAAAGGILLVVVTEWLARRRNDESDRGRHLAVAASAAWLAVPAGVAWWLGFAPGPVPWLVVCIAVLALSLWRGAHAIGPAGGPTRQVLGAAAWIALGAVAALALGMVVAAAPGAQITPPTPRLVTTVYDLDATVATQPLPSCAPAPREVRTLLETGARPSLSPDGRFVWFDATVAGEEGRRQIHRLDRTTREVDCWTCGEPGNNVRPDAGDSGLALVFESDREANWLSPDDSEIFLLGTTRRGLSRRLTFRPGPDERPRLGPSSRLVVWSRRDAGRYEVVSAALRSGHGGILLGNVAVLATGGAAWIAPLAWAPNARTLVLGRGNPFAPLEGIAVDLATGDVAALGDDLAPSAAFVADGDWMAFPTAQGGHWAGALPRSLGFALAPWARSRSREHSLLHGTGVRSGPTEEPTAAHALTLPGELQQWGAPTGLALAPDGRSFVLGQRREESGGVDERLLEISLDCDGTAFARSSRPHP